jgi:hypothetical protein
MCLPQQWAGLEARADTSYAAFAVAGAALTADVVLLLLARRRSQGRM